MLMTMTMRNVTERPGLMKPPGARLRRFVPLKFVARGTCKRLPAAGELCLAGLVDVLIVLVVYLLHSFAPSVELLCTCKAVPLPVARHYLDLEPAPIVRITPEFVALNGDPEADTATLLEDADALGGPPNLRDDLIILKNNFRLLHPDPKEFTGMVLIEADKNLGFGVIGRVLSACRQAGYSRPQLVIQQPSDG